MSNIKSSTDLRNNYNDIFELYSLLNEGRTAIKDGRKRKLTDVITDIRKEITSE